MLIQSDVSCKWLKDSQRFLLEHFDAIHKSPSHIYHSALPICPASSWLRECYSAELSQEVKVVKGLPTGWGSCSRTVSLGSTPRAHTSWKDLIAVGLAHDIIVLDATTGVHLSILSGHTDIVTSVTFSSDGTLLASGDCSGAIKLWDIQTGGVVRTLDGQAWGIVSISISPDHTMIASGSWDKTIRLWNTWTGECSCVINGHNDKVNSVHFSPTNSQLLIAASENGIVQQWDVNGHQIGPAYKGKGVVFSFDGTHFAVWKLGESYVMVRKSDSGAVIAEIKIPSKVCCCCQFSPDGKYVACGVESNIYIWDITSSAPHHVETFIGHTGRVMSITFSSSLTSSSDDQSIKFWQSSAALIDPLAASLQSTPPALAPILSVSLQTNDGIAILVDSAGVVRSWDILTGLCKATFQAPAQMDPRNGPWWGVQLIDDRLILVWHIGGYHLHIWDSKKGGPPQVVNVQWKSFIMPPKISGDGSKAFLLIDGSIRAFSVHTGEVVGEVGLEGDLVSEGGKWLCRDPLIVDGSRVWVHFKDSQIQGWDFGISNSTPIPLSNRCPDGPHLEFSIRKRETNQYRIKDKVTGNDVFQLSGRYADPNDLQWGGGYLVAGYGSGEVVILDFHHILPQQ